MLACKKIMQLRSVFKSYRRSTGMGMSNAEAIGEGIKRPKTRVKAFDPENFESFDFGRALQLVVFDTLVSLVHKVPDCLFFLDAKTPVFNRPLFLSEFVDVESRHFLAAMTDTNAFNLFTASMNSKSLSYFFEAIRRQSLHYSTTSRGKKYSPGSSPLTSSHPSSAGLTEAEEKPAKFSCTPLGSDARFLSFLSGLPNWVTRTICDHVTTDEPVSDAGGTTHPSILSSSKWPHGEAAIVDVDSFVEVRI